MQMPSQRKWAAACYRIKKLRSYQLESTKGHAEGCRQESSLGICTAWRAVNPVALQCAARAWQETSAAIRCLRPPDRHHHWHTYAPFAQPKGLCIGSAAGDKGRPEVMGPTPAAAAHMVR